MVERVPRSKVGRGGAYFTTPKDPKRFISSGSKTLDLALGGGWAEGRIANIIGDSSTGKTLLCIEAAANFAKKYPKNGIIRYRESESAFDQEYAGAIGMPLSRVDFGKDPVETIEDFYVDLEKSTDEALRKNRPELYILDSLDALSDENEMKRKFGEASYGGDKAKDLSRMFRKLPLHEMENSKVTVMVVSQTRDKIGVKFGRKWTRSGGKALTFYCSQIVLLQQIGKVYQTLNKTKHVIGIDIKAGLEKNKVGPAFKTAQFPILFGYGVDDINSCLNFLDSNGKLKEALGTMKEVAFMKAVENRSGDYKKLIERTHAAVEKTWYAIEAELAPRFRKYEL